MKKTLIYSTMLSQFERHNYKYDKEKVYKGEVHFPMNELIANKVKKDDDVRVIIIRNENGKADATLFAEKCKEEVRFFLDPIGCRVEYVEIPVWFEGTTENIKKFYLDLMNNVEYQTEIYMDMTYGPKFIMPVAFAAFDYSEKYFNSDVKNVYYGQVYFDDGKIVAGSETLCDLTSIYRLNSFCKSVNASNDSFKFLVEETFV